MSENQSTAETVTFPEVKILQVLTRKDNGWTRLKLRIGEGARQGDEIIGIGVIPEVRTGDIYEAVMQREVHQKYGEQFQIVSLHRPVPTDLEGVFQYLKKNFTGIGEKRAETLVQTFGSEVLELLDQPDAAERIVERAKWEPKLAESLVGQWRQSVAPKRTELFLIGCHVSGKVIKRLKEYYGDSLSMIIENTPYRLIEVSGIGFKTADLIARRQGLPKDAPDRIWAGLGEALRIQSLSGHCWCDDVSLHNEAVKLLEIDPDLVREIMLSEEVPVSLGIYRDRLRRWWLFDLYEAEVATTERLSDIADRQLRWHKRLTPEVWERARAAFFEKTKINLTDEQESAVRQLADNSLSILTGGPGTGKTTILRFFLEVLAEIDVEEIALAAPTGKAAKRITVTTEREAATIHRLLKLGNSDAAHWRGNPLPAEVVVVDEASMLDIQLMAALADAVRSDSALILIGDNDQLPSVGPGRVLGDLIDAGISTVRLQRIHRQASESMIVRASHDINHGGLPKDLPTATLGLLRDSNFPAEVFDEHRNVWNIEADTEEDIKEIITRLVSDIIPLHCGIDRGEIRTLSPVNRGACGVETLNPLLQEIVNPPNPGKKEVEWQFGKILREGDQLLWLTNNYVVELMNGEDCQVRRLVKPPPGGNEPWAVHLATDLQEVVLSIGELDARHSAATTVHKAQGAEYDAVIIVCAKEHSYFFTRRMLYTGISRAKKLAVLIGKRSNIERIAGRDYETRRRTALKSRIKEAFGRREIIIEEEYYAA